jgi:streptomycin 6-kinase
MRCCGPVDAVACPMFEAYLRKWNLVPDGDPIVTPAARLLPVLRRDEPAILKLAFEKEERLGGVLMTWWDGDGAARVLACDADALLLERATGCASLADMARGGRDDEASRILCAVAARLHAPRAKPLPKLTPLAHWFRALEPAAAKHGGILPRCLQTARSLLADPREVCALHGDLHHDNVLDFGARGWLAIDPKHLVGERTFDFANIFTNPDLADPTRPVATDPGRFARRLEVVIEAAQLDRDRLLRWIIAWTGLSAAWFLGDGDPNAAIDLHIASLAAAELDR